jgi:hypothetical protein
MSATKSPDGEYKQIPVAEAKRIASDFDKHVVIILALDAVFDRAHAATYGVTAESKIYAHKLSEKCLEAIGCTLGDSEYNEDFRRVYDAALFAEARDLIEALVKSQPTGPPPFAELIGMMQDWLRRVKERGEGQRG